MRWQRARRNEVFGVTRVLSCVTLAERSPLVKAAAGCMVAVVLPPEGSNPFPLRHFFW
jgi:hypothetical protein